MGFIGSLLGTSSNYQASGPSPIDVNDARNQAYRGYNKQIGLMDQLGGQNAIANQSDLYNQQQALSNQFGQMGQGLGPNPAQAALAQATAQNTANQAALMGSQRGAGANAGLIARQAAQQGAANQQASVGQAATLQAQQQIAALQQQQAQQQLMSQLGQAQVGNLQNATNAFAQSGQNLYGQTLGAQQSAQNINSQVSQNNAKNAMGPIGGLIGGIGSAVSGIGGALGLGGGSTPDFGNGNVLPGSPAAMGSAYNGPIGPLAPKVGPYAPGQMPYTSAAHGGMIDGPRSRVGQHFAALPMKMGGHVPGKASVKGDSQKNDTVPAMLSPGEIVVPRTKAQDPEKAAAFAKAVAMHGKKGKK